MSFEGMCLSSWPPEPSCLVELMPMTLGFVSSILTISILSFSFEKATDADIKNLETQYSRRHEYVNEIVSDLKEIDDWDSDDLGQDKFRKLYEGMVDLVELPDYDFKTLQNAAYWGWKLFEQELRIGTVKTEEGKMIEYANGKKLDDLISLFDPFYAMCRRGKYHQAVNDRSRVRKQVRQGRRVFRRIQYGGIVKAFMMLWLVRDSSGWIILESFVSMTSAMTSALGIFYRAEVLEAVHLGGNDFWVAVKAMVQVQLLSSLLNLLSRTLQVRGRSMVAHQVKIKYFEAVLQRDATWWTIMDKEEKEPLWELFDLDDGVKDFLEIPQSLGENLSSIVTHVYLIVRKSSQSFYFLLVLNFGTPVVSWLLRQIIERLRPIVMKGVVLPSYQDQTWFHAMDSKYAETFQSYARSDKEILAFTEYDKSSLKYEKRFFLLDAFEDPVQALLSSSIDSAQMQASGKLVTRGKANIAEAQALMGSSEAVADTTESSWSLIKELVERAQPLANVYDLYTLPQVIDMTSGLYPSDRAKGHIELKNVKFSYPSRKVPVLKDVTMEARSGESIGLCGKAGCGKTTVMKLLQRIYDVDDGQILLDGRDI